MDSVWEADGRARAGAKEGWLKLTLREVELSRPVKGEHMKLKGPWLWEI